LELRQLRTFLSLAELGSLTRAADQLRIAQPALSRQIRMLEEEIGLPLFLRHSRGMQLTEAGAALLRFASGPLRQLEIAVAQVRELETEVSGEVALGLMPSVADIFAGRLAERVAEALPKVSLRIAEAYVPHLVEWLQRGDLDATLSYAGVQGSGLKITHLLQEDMLLIGPPESGLNLDKSVACATLASIRLVLPSMPSGLRKVVEQAAADANVKLDVKVEADAYVVLKHLVSVGKGYTILPMSAVARDLASRRLRAAPLVEPTLTRQICLLEPKERSSSRATRAVLEILQHELAQLIAAGEWPAIPLQPLLEFMG
jgi:DNA-binding transcriptional LysR family regulator